MAKDRLAFKSYAEFDEDYAHEFLICSLFLTRNEILRKSGADFFFEQANLRL